MGGVLCGDRNRDGSGEAESTGTKDWWPQEACRRQREWVVVVLRDEGSYKYQLRPHDQSQKEGLSWSIS